jgi:3-hydroxy-9,10-secoandrosta-1,3,5(10)-triene-9,17-dione monooxygenase
MAGASSFSLGVVGQRHMRDAVMLANHAVLNYEANVGILGSLVAGNEPKSFFL